MTIAEGAGVFPSTAAANHDPEAFPRPQELIIRRPASKHLAFGHGRHHCLGADLSRLELAIVFETLFQRLPGLPLAAPFEDFTYRDGSLVYGLEELPVTW